MSWLYDHRHQLDRLGSLVEIAHWAVVSHVPPEDQDDVEQVVVLSLMATVEKYGNKGKNYLKAVAWSRICEYLRKKYQERRRFCRLFEGEKGKIVRGTWELVHDGDTDARLDAIAVLDTLPQRLIAIGHKLLNEERLSEADQHYWIRQKAKLRPELSCRRYANHLADWEKRRIVRLHGEGLSLGKIAKAMGRTSRAVKRCLVEAGLSSPWPSGLR